MRSLLIVLAIGILPSVVLAQSKPPEISKSIQAAAPVGVAEMNKLVFHVYDASFWSDQEGVKTPYALSITYDMDFEKGDLIARTVKEMKHVSALPDATLQQYAAQLAGIWPDINKGDRITAYTADGKQTVFYYNSKKVGVISDAQFTPAFFGIWLSEKTSEPQMRKELLGL